MRLIHFSDLHLGVDNHGALDPETGLSTRVLDFLRVFDLILDRAIADRVDAVLFTGDAFKNRDPSPTLQREFARRVLRLSRADIPIVILVGNHDLPNVASRATPVEIYGVLEIQGVYVSRSIERLNVATRSGPLQIVTLPWIPRSGLLGLREYRELDDLALDRETQQLVSEAIADKLRGIDPTQPSVLMAHVSIQGASLGQEQSIMLGKDITVGRDDVHARSFDYVALGHIHKHQVIGTHPPVVYAGSPERIDFGEEREPKGYVIVDIENGSDGRETQFEFVELPARRFRTLRIEARGDTPDAQVTREIERAGRDIRDAIVRCVIEVDTGRERGVVVADVRKALLAAGASHVAQVVVESETTARARVAVSDEVARDAAQMLERWVEQKQYDARLTERVLARGREMIARRRQEESGEAD